MKLHANNEAEARKPLAKPSNGEECPSWATTQDPEHENMIWQTQVGRRLHRAEGVCFWFCFETGSHIAQASLMKPRINFNY